MVTLIVTDLDKTLLNDKKEISNYSAEVLKKCQKNGIPVVFATARPERATTGFQEVFQPDYVISNNGATISCKGRILYNQVIPTDVRNQLLSTLISMKDITCLTAEAGHCLYTNYTGEPWDAANWNPVYHDFSEPLPEPISKISIECKNKELLLDLISPYPSLHLYLNSGEDWSQVMPVTATKMNAIHYLSNVLGLQTQDIVAFGDDFNDIEMIQACGKGIAVENAIEAVKQAAYGICKSNHDNGVAKWIDENLMQ